MATVDLGAGASGWSAERRARVRALIGALVERLTGLGGAPERGGVADADAEENRATAVAFVEGNLRHHTFLDVNPSQLGRKYGALEERFRRRAQLRKAEALRALAGRLSRTPSPEQEPEANYAVLSALLALANEPPARRVGHHSRSALGGRSGPSRRGQRVRRVRRTAGSYARRRAACRGGRRRRRRRGVDGKLALLGAERGGGPVRLERRRATERRG